MSQTYDDKGVHTPVTVLDIGPCIVAQVKTVEKDGYAAVQLGYGEKKNASRANVGHGRNSFTGKQGRTFRYIKEARLASVDGIKIGSTVDPNSFVIGEHVQVTGWSKGRGFTGVVKRHHFHGHPPTHGHKDQERMPGSIGAGGVQHVFKGIRMAGRMGNEQVTVKNLTVVKIDEFARELWVKGAVPGSPNGLVIIAGIGEMKFLVPQHNSTEKKVVETTADSDLSEEARSKNQEAGETQVADSASDNVPIEQPTAT